MKQSRSEKVQKFKVENTTLMEMLKDLRAEMGYTTAQLAPKYCMSASSYNGYETGQTKNITPEMLERFFTLPYEKLYKAEYEKTGKNYDDFIIMKITTQFSKYSKELLSQQLWIYYLSLTHTYVNTNPVMMKKLEDMYETDVWRVIFGTLNLNPTLKRKHIYPEKNVIYIDELTIPEKEKGIIPIFRINYELSSEQISEKQNLAFDKGKISVVDLFMLIFNREIRKYTDEQEAFISSCKIINTMGANFIYNKLGFFSLPENDRAPISMETIKLINELNEFLSSKREMINVDEMKIFYSNLQNLRFHFINTVSVDFSFINNLTEELRSDLKRQIVGLVQNFKNEHLGSKYSE